MTERLENAIEALKMAADELQRAADEGPPRSSWGAELRQTAKRFEWWAEKIGEWLGRKA